MSHDHDEKDAKGERADMCPYHLLTSKVRPLDCMACAICASQTLVQSLASAGPYKCGDEFLPYHRSASHVEPAYRDGWNACFEAARADTARMVAEAVAREHEEILRLAKKHREDQCDGHAIGAIDELVAAIRARSTQPDAGTP